MYPARPTVDTRLRGFTLIELLITLAIVGLLTSVALPTYKSAVRKAHRSDAKAALLDLATREEKYYAVTNQFSGRASDLGYSALPLAISTSGTGTSYYSLSVSAPGTNPPTYTATATPTGTQMGDTDCYSFWISQTGEKRNLSSGGTRITTSTCW